MLLKNVIDLKTGRKVADHLWFNFTLGFEDAEPKENDVLEFNARVKMYSKGYQGNRADELGEASFERDWKLSFPTKVCNRRLKACNPSVQAF